jgi:N-acetylmuramic acid 6-phosphate etherase
VLSTDVPSTEEVNPASVGIDAKSSRDIVRAMHEEDGVAWRALEPALDAIAAVVDAVAEAFRRGGRLIYVGAGTSGRLGVLDASECPPTFGVDPNLVVGVIAGGDIALRRAVEGAEDNPQAGATSIADLIVGEKDVVCGIAASGSTPFVRGAILESRRRRATTAFITSNTRLDDRALLEAIDHRITLAVGPEIIAGSTRMKCGTATKMALNQITTAAMVLRGKVYDNLMVDVVASNAKLRRRARRLVCRIGAVDEARAAALLEEAGGSVKVALVVHAHRLDAPAARQLLERCDGRLRQALECSA